MVPLRRRFRRKGDAADGASKRTSDDDDDDDGVKWVGSVRGIDDVA